MTGVSLKKKSEVCLHDEQETKPKIETEVR